MTTNIYVGDLIWKTQWTLGQVFLYNLTLIKVIVDNVLTKYKEKHVEKGTRKRTKHDLFFRITFFLPLVLFFLTPSIPSSLL